MVILHPRPFRLTLSRFSVLSLLVPCLILIWIQWVNGSVIDISVNLPFLSPQFGKIPGNIVKFLKANEQALLGGIDPTGQHSFRVHYIPTNGTVLNSTLALRQAIEDKNVKGVIGDLTDEATTMNAALAVNTKTWTCSGASNLINVIQSPPISIYYTGRNSLSYSFPYFFRTVPDRVLYELTITSLIDYIGWKNVSIIYSTALDTIASPVVSRLSAKNTTFTAPKISYFDEDEKYFTQMVDNALDEIFAAQFQIVLLVAPTNSAFSVLKQARKRGMLSNQWSWILASDPLWNTWNRTAEELQLLNGVLQVRPRENSYNQRYNESVARFLEQYPGEWIAPTSFYYADCMTMMATALLRIVNDLGEAALVTKSYWANQQEYVLVPFTGLSGDFTFYEYAKERVGIWEVINWYDGVPTLVFNGTEIDELFPKVILEQKAPIRFASGTSDVPTGLPVQTNLVVSWGSPTHLGLTAFNGVFIAIMSLIWVVLLLMRNRPIIRNLNFLFLSLVTLGCILVLVSSLISIGKPTPESCQTSFCLFITGIALICANCAVKTIGLYRSYDNPLLSRKPPSTLSVLVRVVGAVLVQIIILIIWSVDRPLGTLLVTARYYTDERCDISGSGNPSPYLVVSIVYNCILLATVVLYSFKTRKFTANLMETLWIFYSTQSIILSDIVITVFTFVNFGDTYPIVFVLRQCCICYMVVFTFTAIVGRGAVAACLPQKGKTNKKADESASTSVVNSKNSADNTRLQQMQEALQGSVLLGEYALKRCGGIMETWHTHFIVLDHSLGILQMTPVDTSMGAGIALRTSEVQASESKLELCLQLVTQGKGTWVLQFLNAQDCSKWQTAINSKPCDV